MSRFLPLIALSAALAIPGLARAQDPHAGHVMPTPEADPHAGHMMPAPTDNPHAGHVMPAPEADPHAGHMMPAPGDPATVMTGADLPVGDAPPPPVPADDLADGVYDPAAMAQARDGLRAEHGRVRFAMTMLDTFELRPGGDGGGYAWGGEFRYGGDVNRLALKTEGEGEFDGGVGKAEVQALYSRAIGPYFDLQAGVRQDFQPRPRRTYATVGVEGLAPYWFEVGAAVFLSDEGELTARLEGGYDLRLTQRLIVEPRAELTLSASDAPDIALGSGLADAEFGLRLRYEFSRQFAPYLGVHYERRFGGSADFARAAGDHVSDTQFVVGVRAWF